MYAKSLAKLMAIIVAISGFVPLANAQLIRPGQLFPPLQLPVGPKNPIRGQQFPIFPPVHQPGRWDDGRLQDFVENKLERHFGHFLNDIDVSVRRGVVEIEVEVRDYNRFVALQNFVAAMPELRGHRVHVIWRDLEDHVERRIERALRGIVDRVDVEVNENRRSMRIEVELRQLGAENALRTLLATMPELRGYRVQLRIEFDR